MIIKPMIRNNICLNAHPEGCARFVRSQIEYVRTQAHKQAPAASRLANVLVIGASAGYGLASRVVSAFGYRANTLGVAFEKASSGKRTGTPGWYCDREFTTAATADGLRAETIIGDAFSDEVRDEVMRKLKADYGTIDLVIYSLASGVRTDPVDGMSYRSALKPIGQSFSARSIDPIKSELLDVTIAPANDEEIASTVKVMGGEDWELWTRALINNDLFTKGARNVAYSYIGPELTFPVYRDGTIGRAKANLEASAADISKAMDDAVGGRAFVSVNKAVVTRASAVIPVVPLYLAILFKVMKERNLHEDVIHQMYRLFTTRLYADNANKGSGDAVPCDEEGRIRIDDWEMRPDVQQAVEELWGKVNADNLAETTDLEGYRESFLNVHGFGFPQIDYNKDIAI